MHYTPDRFFRRTCPVPFTMEEQKRQVEEPLLRMQSREVHHANITLSGKNGILLKRLRTNENLAELAAQRVAQRIAIQGEADGRNQDGRASQSSSMRATMGNLSGRAEDDNDSGPGNYTRSFALSRFNLQFTGGVTHSDAERPKTSRLIILGMGYQILH